MSRVHPNLLVVSQQFPSAARTVSIGIVPGNNGGQIHPMDIKDLAPGGQAVGHFLLGSFGELDRFTSPEARGIRLLETGNQFAGTDL